MLPAIQATTGSLAARIAQVKKPATGAGMSGFLKFAFDSGEYLFGRDQEDVTGDHVLVNTNSICHGWTIWVDGKATKTLVTFDRELPEAPPAVGKDQPSESRAFGGAFYDDGKPGDQLVFETNSYGGRKGVDKLIGEVIDRVTAGETVYLYPVVKLASESYKNKNYMNKLIHNPIFEVVKWCDVNGLEAGAEAPSLAAPAAPEAEPEPEQSAPRRRRVAS